MPVYSFPVDATALNEALAACEGAPVASAALRRQQRRLEAASDARPPVWRRPKDPERIEAAQERRSWKASLLGACDLGHFRRAPRGFSEGLGW